MRTITLLTACLFGACSEQPVHTPLRYEVCVQKPYPNPVVTIRYNGRPLEKTLYTFSTNPKSGDVIFEPIQTSGPEPSKLFAKGPFSLEGTGCQMVFLEKLNYL
jgi:hypothetical protein